MSDNRKVMMVVEDDPDVRLLVKVALRQDPRIEINGEVSSAEEAIEHCRVQPPGLVVLDHMLDGEMSGLEAAPLIKQAAPDAKILLFSALELAKQARAEPAVDEFLLKTKFVELLPICQRLLVLDPIG